ncbi:serine/threonine-protein kinase [Streptomyces sp. FIT100]|uniref:serine/threonine-protein kinase n=1 Tax=Streptomyces sp. FIT100 TaxID=2837956 RepID=UPI0021C9E5B7|nr:serine/threonine-protein kinase [Streptomyces sp. FIT100]UUN26012.1 serine/threonine protein kinase [Streptomyces sp. FIT100]
MSEVPDGERDCGRDGGRAGGRAGDGTLIADRYRLLGRLGEGGMGVVWRARDELLGREVAIKEVRAPAGLGATDVQRLYARLEREGWAAARISQRNVVTVYDVASHDGRPWIVMELIRGLSLAEVLDAEGPMAPRRAAHIGAEVLAALRGAHEAGVLHRDVKPGNVLLANDGRVVLTDFGIAMVEGTSNLTMTGELVGSPEFLAPERALGRTPGAESDLWSLGVLLYAAVEGVTPFRQDTPLSTLRAVVDEELPPPRRAGALAPVIEGLLRKDPAARLSAREADRELRIVGAGGTPRTGSTPVPSSGPYATTVSPAAPTAATAPAGGFGPPTPPTGALAVPPERPRRARAALVAGIAVLLLSIGGLGYALLGGYGNGYGNGNGNGNGGSTGGAGNGAANGGASGGGTAGPSATGDDPSGGTPGTPGTPSTTDTAPTGGAGSATATPPQQTVHVYAQAVTGSYSGSCPPPEAEAPAFTATVTVGRTPASVTYRWVTESGKGSGGGWKTLDFPAGKGTSQRVAHIERTYAENATHHDRIRLEVRSPVGARSNWVAFSVTCEEESPSPTGEPSYAVVDPAGSADPLTPRR